MDLSLEVSMSYSIRLELFFLTITIILSILNVKETFYRDPKDTLDLLS